ncbi:MAG: uncharacterized protein KVP18_004805 [Porospora cf. gigantea A]|uniref:uncharacterized protein n=1 Tax=Porospora cf. gigantea A TaxID=2853593 RepID=UPI003559CC0B|nr:MAG: hypothetical protein KVP18_004805 [Porospora cf. gigantea A]
MDFAFSLADDEIPLDGILLDLDLDNVDFGDLEGVDLDDCADPTLENYVDAFDFSGGHIEQLNEPPTEAANPPPNTTFCENSFGSVKTHEQIGDGPSNKLSDEMPDEGRLSPPNKKQRQEDAFSALKSWKPKLAVTPMRRISTPSTRASLQSFRDVPTPQATPRKLEVRQFKMPIKPNIYVDPPRIDVHRLKAPTVAHTTPPTPKIDKAPFCEPPRKRLDVALHNAVNHVSLDMPPQAVTCKERLAVLTSLIRQLEAQSCRSLAQTLEVRVKILRNGLRVQLQEARLLAARRPLDDDIRLRTFEDHADLA